MYLQTVALERIDYNVVKNELLYNIENGQIPTLNEVKEALASMYVQACRATAQFYYVNLENFESARASHFSVALAGFNLWERLKKLLCEFLSPTTTADEIIDNVLQYVAAFIPGGIYIGNLVSKLIRYIATMRYAQPCTIEKFQI